MKRVANHYDLLAALFRYPVVGYLAGAELCRQVLAGSELRVAERLGAFLDGICGLSVEELQALFTATFDLDPVCSLEVGWHLFGENYERGEFLVKMRSVLRRHGVAETSELPDHLTHVLSALGRMVPEEADEFAAACVHPALDKMRAGIAGKSNPFENALAAVTLFVESRHARPPVETSASEPAFRILNAGGVR